MAVAVSVKHWATPSPSPSVGPSANAGLREAAVRPDPLKGSKAAGPAIFQPVFSGH